MRYHVLDVFTDTAFAGNPLAVVMDEGGLSDERMQAIAAEFGLSETVFLRPPAEATHRAALRIFTPQHEIPFAGHPTIGTAVLLSALDADEDGDGDRLVVLEERIGPVRVGVTAKHGVAYASFDIPKLPQADKRIAAPADLASAVGLMSNELGFANHVPSAFDAGLPYVCIPVRDEEALARARPVTGLWKAFGAGQGAYLYTAVKGGYAARMFDPSAGITEDPATGSAAACLAGAIHRFDALRDGDNALVLHQGREMGRPSRLDLTLTQRGGRLTRVRIGGHAVRVMEGVLL